MCSREILTLQFGHYSNYVGTNWWNVQELGFEYKSDNPSEINHDILYREGLTNKGEVTFTPRLLLVDLKGSLKSLPEQGNLYEPPFDPSKIEVQWENPPEIKENPKIPKSNYQQEIENPAEPKESYKLEEDVRVWSDFLYTRFHPRTVNVIKEYEHENESSPFNAFTQGTNLWKTEPFEDNFADSIRNYVEECDSFQGFQILLDSTNAFSGLATSCMEHLRDDYENKTVFALPIIPSHYPGEDDDRHKTIINDSIRVLNLGFCYNSLMENSSLFVPLSTAGNGWRQLGQPKEFNNVEYDSKLWYHSSAILASALDTFTLKYRMKNSMYSLSDLAVDLTPHGRKAAAASLCLPFSLNQDTDLIDCLDNWEGPLSKSITPNCEIGDSRMMQLITLRGVDESRLKRPIDKAGKQKDMPAYKCKNINEMLNMYLAYTCHATASNVTNISKGLSVRKPYPNIFKEKVGRFGNIMAEPRNLQIGVETVPVLSGLHSGTELGGMVESLHTEMKKIKIGRFHQFTTTGVEKDEFNECLDRLFDFRECYEDNYFI